MTMMTAKQNPFSATSGDVSSAARAFAAILLILGAVMTAPLFVSLRVIVGLILLAVILLPLVSGAACRPRHGRESY